MKFLRPLVLAVACALLTGCLGYTKFRATNPRGEMIAEWTAKGFFYPVSGGYRIKAVERVSGPPMMHVSRYPNGFPTMVTGHHIQRWHVDKPLWLYELERPNYPTANLSRREVPQWVPVTYH